MPRHIIPKYFHSIVLFYQGAILLEYSYYKYAYFCFHEAARLEPTAIRYDAMGTALHSLGQYSEALGWYDTLLDTLITHRFEHHVTVIEC